MMAHAVNQRERAYALQNIRSHHRHDGTCGEPKRKGVTQYKMEGRITGMMAHEPKRKRVPQYKM